jgi:septal ring factor EnvC (AmiA/AmiB activator)
MRTSSTHSNLRTFPHLEPVSEDRLRAITRELLEIADLEQAMLQRIKSLSIGLTELQSAKKSAVAEQKTLLEKLARGAKLAG